MAVRIRLTRIGKKKQPSYRIVAMDKDSKRDGKYIEQIGFYNPMVEPIDLRVDIERYNHWLGVGARSSEAVTNLVKRFSKDNA